MKEIKINGFTLAPTGDVFENRGLFIYMVKVISLPDGSRTMPRNTTFSLTKQNFFGEEIQGVESFAKMDVRIGDTLGIRIKNRLREIEVLTNAFQESDSENYDDKEKRNNYSLPEISRNNVRQGKGWGV